MLHIHRYTEFRGIGNLLEAPDVWGRVARNPVQQECREPLLQEDRSSREQVVYGLPLLLSAVPRQRRAKLPEQARQLPLPGGNMIVIGNALIIEEN